MKEVIILGGMGNGTVIAHAITDAHHRGATDLVVAGFCNDRLPAGEQIEGFSVIGGLDAVPQLLEDDYYFINTIYRIDGNPQRIALFENLNIPHQRLATFVHPAAYVAPEVVLHPGCVVLPNAAVSPGAELGRGCLIMVNATVGHNSKLHPYCHCAAQSCISSCVTLEKGVHVGLNATVGDGLHLGQFSTLAMGAVLTRNLPEYQIWAGNPARFLRRTQ